MFLKQNLHRTLSELELKKIRTIIELKRTEQKFFSVSVLELGYFSLLQIPYSKNRTTFYLV
jgi:hypothetical protein